MHACIIRHDLPEGEASKLRPLTMSNRPVIALWLDSVEPGAHDPHRPLHGIETLQVTPRVASTTRESRQRSAWAVARRIDELLEAPTSAPADFKSTIPGALADLEADSLSP